MSANVGPSTLTELAMSAVTRNDTLPLPKPPTASTATMIDDPLTTLEHRLTVICDRVCGVAHGHSTGFYLFGRAGTAKTYTIRKTLDKHGFRFYYHHGHVTPLGLFELLAEHPDRVIVLDDVAELLRNPIAMQILLAALGNQPDETGARIIKYRRQNRDETVHFTGGMILISNLELGNSPLLVALKSRIHYLCYDPTDEQIAALMRAVASKGWRKLSPAECLEVTDFLIAESQQIGCHLDLRLLVDKAFPDYLQWREGHAQTHWKDLIRATLEERLVELKYTVTTKMSREETKDHEHAVIRDILLQYDNKKDRLAGVDATMHKSERRFTAG